MAVNDPLQDNNRPYPPTSNVIGVLHRLRSRNLPERIDIDYLRDAGIPEGSIHRVAFALRFLGLIKNDMPTSALRTISTSTDEEYRDILSNLVREAYREVFEIVDPAEDSPERIVNVFRRYAPASQRQRMVMFFLGMCREAGIPTLDAPRQRATNDTSTPKMVKAKVSRSTSSTTRSKGSSPFRSLSPGDEVSGIPPALAMLVRSLPSEGTPMTMARRNQWLNMAGAALAFLYPEEEPGVEVEPIDLEEADDME